MKRVSVIGAGFSGLTSAYYLMKAGYQVEVFEAARVGGLIGTVETSHGPVETAANGVLASRRFEELCAELGVPLVATLREARRRFIFRDQRARRWPLGFRASLAVARFLIRYVFARKSLQPHAGETVHDWGERVLGAEATAFMIEAALQGIYAGDPRQMSASLLFGKYFSPGARPARGHLRGTVAPAKGMGELITALERRLLAGGVTFHRGSSVKLSARPNHPHIIATSSSSAAEVISAVSPRRAEWLRQIPMLSLVSTTAFFSRNDAKTSGFGCLFAPREQAAFLGVLKNSFIFPQRSRVGFSETWIGGGASRPEFVQQADREILTQILEQRLKFFSLDEKPLSYRITKWPLALPHYTLEVERALQNLQVAQDNIFLVGNYLGSLGLAQILEQTGRVAELIALEGQWT